MGTGSCSVLLRVYRIEADLESRHGIVGVVPGGQSQSVAALEPRGGC